MHNISGLIYLPEYISQPHHDWLTTQIDSQVWDTGMKRRVQHYGYRYDYKARKVTPEMYLGDLPEWLTRIAKQLHYDGLIDAIPDQVIINEYQPGQGIAAHIDCEPCFGNRVFSLSLGGSAIMEFSQPSQQTVEVLLEPRSLVMIYGEARYDWKHAIPARKSDNMVPRTRRISLTFRKVTI
ncbi:MAG: alpha-ketoglutarate-dependent dioxygenase AlkB [Candidatus Promineifilaceae bacterium]